MNARLTGLRLVRNIYDTCKCDFSTSCRKACGVITMTTRFQLQQHFSSCIPSDIGTQILSGVDNVQFPKKRVAEFC